MIKNRLVIGLAIVALCATPPLVTPASAGFKLAVKMKAFDRLPTVAPRGVTGAENGRFCGTDHPDHLMQLAGFKSAMKAVSGQADAGEEK